MPQYIFTNAVYNIFAENMLPQLVAVSVQTDKDAPVFQNLHRYEDRASLLIVIDGSLNLAIENESYSLKAGDIACINAGILHGMALDKGKQNYKTVELSIKNLHIQGLMLGELLERESYPVIAPADSKLAIHYARILIELGKDCEKTYAAQTANYLLGGLLTIVRQEILAAKGNEKLNDYNLGQQIKEYLDEHYLENLKLPQIAAALHMNMYYLAHTFKKSTGQSPMQYVTHRRIAEAQNMLLSTDLAITEIALRCGWNDSNYFQNVFSSTVGMPPGKYRKIWKN